MSRTGLYPGTFDPPTLGHLDLIRRAAGLFDRLLVAVLVNPGKAPLFTAEERVALIRAEVAGIAGVAVRSFGGLVVDLAAEEGARAIVRGLRNGTDLDYELPMAGMNAAMSPAVETLFLAAAPALAPVASSLVRDVARHGGEIGRFVTPSVAAAVARKLG